MPSGKEPAGDESRPTNGVRGVTTRGSAAVKRPLKEINGLPSEDKKELSASLMGLALIEEEKLEEEKSLRTASKTGKHVTKGISGGSRPKTFAVAAGAPSGANKGVEIPPRGNSGRYECFRVISTDDSEEVNSQDEVVRRSATGT